jgi:hypothetical protein
VLGNDYQALAAGFVHPPAGFASSPTGTIGTTSTPGLRMITRTEFSFEPQDCDLMIESAIIDSRLVQVCGTGQWFPATPIHYHSNEISWSRVVPVGRGTGAG